MNKFLSLVLAAGVAFGLAACQNTESQQGSVETPVETVTLQITGMT